MDGTTAGPHCLNSRRDKQGPISFTSKPNSRLPCTWSRATDRRPDRAHVSTAPWTFGAPRTTSQRLEQWRNPCTAPLRARLHSRVSMAWLDPLHIENVPCMAGSTRTGRRWLTPTAQRRG
ncbi:hypothetical protein SORBI_3009G153366 [Sorghum bicolor]|uniref:Uncharacterized protein n=1 Tax=Sorghum bicolor TaxID=4558 RepID=A0A1Z5R3S5_SORBI|nr:hypothetical protein SORBI_3009G153366 [Sorghum bicolor]OQU78095.1 hypothetical protein SORBI_3009G153366 [Sorghum bicolor]